MLGLSISELFLHFPVCFLHVVLATAGLATIRIISRDLDQLRRFPLHYPLCSSNSKTGITE